MSEVEFRRCTADDYPQTEELWCRVFGDIPAVPKYFLDGLDGLGAGFVAVSGGLVIGCAFAVTDFTLEGERIGYIYAVAVDEKYRGRGIGAKLTRTAAEYVKSIGAILAIQPAEDSLFRWYEDIIGTKCAVYRRRIWVKAENTCAVSRIGETEYYEMRSRLAPKPQVILGNSARSYQTALLEAYGGGYYAFPGGVAAMGDGTVHEIIGGGERECAAIAYAAGLENVTAFFPADSGEMYIAALPGTIRTKIFWNLSLN